MSKILIHGGLIVPVFPRDTYDVGYLIIEGQRIAEMKFGAYEGTLEGFDHVVDATGKIVMPGLINTHGHAGMTLLRSFADDLPLMEWLEQKCWPIEDKMTEEDMYWGTMLAILEMVKTGTTTFTDMYFHMDAVARAAEESGIRAVLSRGMVSFPPKGDIIIDESYQFVSKWEGKGEGRITTMLGPHAPYTCSPEYLQRVVSMSEELGKPLQIHLSETAFEVNESQKQHGKSPIVLMRDLGLFNRPTLAAHCVHLDEQDIAILKEHDVRVAHNAKSNQKLGSGVAPVRELLAAGVTVGLGTDGAASNNILDMFEEMRAAALIHKAANEDPMAIPAMKALEMATVDGARALFLEASLGTLQAGALADLILLDYNQPHFHPRHDVISQIVYAGHSSDVTDVMIHGQFVVRDKKCLTLDEARIYAQVAKCCEHLFQD